MRRIIFIVSLVALLIAGIFYYRYSVENNEQLNRAQFDVVMAEKMRDLYSQAQDWSKPMQFEIEDSRLKGDYKRLSEFVLNYWVSNIEQRNAYLRSLKAEKWDEFLSIERLVADRKKDYQQTQNMLSNVKQATLQYQKNNQESNAKVLNDVQQLNVRVDMRDALYEKLKQNIEGEQNNTLIDSELKIIEKAEALFVMLKTHPWENKDGKVLFYKDSEVKKFNTLYQDILRINLQIDQKKSHNAQEIEQEIEQEDEPATQAASESTSDQTAQTAK